MSAPVSSEVLTMISLEPIWVPFTDAELKERAEKPQRQTRNKPGPNGEPADSGRWKLRWPTGGVPGVNTLEKARLMSRLPFGLDGVYNGPSLSPSAVETYAGCTYKWALSRLDDLPRPTSEKAEMGDARHNELEGWLKFGIAPTSPGMAKVIEHFPMPGQCESEVYFGFIFGKPGKEVVFAGYLDARESVLSGLGDHSHDVYFDDDGNEVIDMPTSAVAPRRMNSTIRDLKTTGSFDWKKTAAQLRANLQACLYGLGEMLRVEQARTYMDWVPRSGLVLREAITEKVEFVFLKWTYALITKQGIIKKVETVCEDLNVDGTNAKAVNGLDGGPGGGVTLTREQAISTVATFLPLAEQMFNIIIQVETDKEIEKNRAAALGLPMRKPQGGWAARTEKNPIECAAYGGCEWKREGSGSIGEVVEEVIEDGVVKRLVKVAGIACDPPVQIAGSVFKSLMKQERVRIGVISEGADGVVSSAGFLKKHESGATKMTTTSALSGRFAKKLNGNEAAAVAPAAAAAAAAPAAAAVAPAAAAVAPAAVAAAAPAKGLAGRFAPKVKDESVPKVEQKAATDGIAASAKPAEATVAAASADGAPTLMDRLKKVNGDQSAAGAGAGAIEKAAAAAPTHAVGAAVTLQATGQLATGINPPDAAPEWTPEQQAAEAKRLAAKSGSGVVSDVAPDPKADTVPAAQADPDSQAGAGAAITSASVTAVARVGRGKKAAAAAVDQLAANAANAATAAAYQAGMQAGTQTQATTSTGPVTVASALAEIDAVAVKLMTAGFRKEAMVVMKVAVELAA